MHCIHQLDQLQQQLQLEEKALQNVKQWVQNDECEIDSTITEKFRYHFKHHKLCFKHASLSYHYIETTYTISYEENEVGYYSLFTTIEGKAVDDQLEITDKSLQHSR